MSGFANVCVKFILFSFNMLLSIAGLLVAGFGAYWLFQGKSWNEITSGNFNAVFIAIVVVGALMFFVSSLGCCGAAKGNSFMLLTYTLILVIFLGLQVALASFLLIKKADTVEFIVEKMDYVFRESRENKGAEGLRDVIQISFSCCGLTGKSWYVEEDLPKSCCTWEDQDKACRKGSTGGSSGILNEQGCHLAYENWLSSKVQVVVIVLFAVSLVELIAVSFSCYLSKRSE